MVWRRTVHWCFTAASRIHLSPGPIVAPVTQCQSVQAVTGEAKPISCEQTIYDQTQRWLKAGSFEAIVHDLRELLRVAQGRNAQPSAVILDARTLQSTPESGARAGYDGHKRKRGSKTHIAVDTLGHLLAVVVTPANEQERAQAAQLAEAVQEVTSEHVELAYVDQGYTGEDTA